VDEYMLSTSDNPYSPVTQYQEWKVWDQQHGYHTEAYLARVTTTSDELSDADQAAAVDSAMNDIIEAHAGGLYVKVKVPSSG